MSDNKSKLEANKEFGFLYKKSQKLKPTTISQIALIPEFCEVLQNYTGELTDDVIYEVLSVKFAEMWKNHNGYRRAHDTINKVSRDIKGDTSAWKSKL